MKRPIAEILAELHETEEHLQLEAKKGLGDSALETISAFSNETDLGGGTILFGVVKKDGHYEVVGVPNPEALTEDLQSQVSGQSLNHAVRPIIWTETFEGRALVAVFVPEASPPDKPIYLRKRGLPKGAYRRIGNGDVQCSDDDIRLFHQLAADTAYEDSFAPHATMDDLDVNVIEQYRGELLKRRPDSAMRPLDPHQTVQALGCAREDGGTLKPTVAGVLLFAKSLSLARVFPMVRVDYLRLSGTKWIEGDSILIESVDVQQPLLVTYRKILGAILDDLPKSAKFERGSLIRTDEPSVPARAIREVLVNALCHRDYRANTPTQVVRFSNRIEFRNAGYSLVEEEKLGQPGSASRNPRIARVFREIGVAETIGSGIRLMREQMEAANLARPLFESSREANRFVATLMFTHLFTDEQRVWLATLGDSITKEQQLALVYCREVGEIRNAVLRDLTGLDTLAASAALRGLRDRGLLEPRGASAQTYYVLGPVVGLEVPKGGELKSETGGLQAETGELKLETGGLETPQLTRESLLADLPAALRQQVLTLGARAPEGEVQAVILDLCTLRAWRPVELALLLGRRQVKHLVSGHLAPMTRDGRLERTHPDAPSHPEQAYRTPRGRS